MTYLGGNRAISSGRIWRNCATAPLRAFTMAAWSLAGRIGRIDATDSSVAKASAMARTNCSPFFRPDTCKNASIATRSSTSSELGAGSSSGTEGGSVLDGSDTPWIPAFVDEPQLNGVGFPSVHHNLSVCVASARHTTAGRLFNRYIRGLALGLAFAGCAFVWVQLYGFLGGHL